MTNIKLPLRLSLAALLACGASACSKDAQKARAHEARVEQTSGAITQTETHKATVQAVDPAKRLVTLRDEHGMPYTLDVGNQVDLTQIHPEDSVRVAYQETVAFRLADEDQAQVGAGPNIEESAHRIPDGVQFGRKISTTVKIVSVTPDGSHATFRGPEGATRTVFVDDPPNQKKIANLRPGDAVAVTYTEKLAVAVDPAFDD